MPALVSLLYDFNTDVSRGLTAVWPAQRKVAVLWEEL